MKIVILDETALCQNDLDWSALAQLGEVTAYARTSAQQVVERIGDAPMVVTNKVVIDEAVMNACPALRYIGVTATGYNVVDVQAASRRGIVVTNVPAYSTQAVAQHVMALLLHEFSRVAAYDAQVKQGEWVKSPDFCFYTHPMEEIAGKTLGVVGFGHIGQAVARAARGLGMDVAIHTPHPKAELLESGMRFVSLEELFALSDVITLHCPLKEENRGLINAQAIARMREGVRIINTARGPLVDAQAMAEALRQGRVACYMADVLEAEPPRADDPLLSAPNTVITPHVAWAPKQTRERLMGVVAENIRAFLAGEPRNVVSGGTK